METNVSHHPPTEYLICKGSCCVRYFIDVFYQTYSDVKLQVLSRPCVPFTDPNVW